MSARVAAFAVVALALIASAGGATTADPGVTSSTVLLGGTVPLTGEAAAFGTVAPGAKAYFDYMNAKGGVNGRVHDLAVEPALVNASWDWGGGDWETALGAAAHMGRRDIALALLEGGARLDLFAAAMLGHTQIVSAVLTAFPQMRDGLGPHGIPLVEHARAGGEQALAVLELLEA